MRKSLRSNPIKSKRILRNFYKTFPFSCRFWDKKSENCPEVRTEIAMKSKQTKEKHLTREPLYKEEKFVPRLFAACGRPYNLNVSKLKFEFKDEPDRYELELFVYK